MVPCKKQCYNSMIAAKHVWEPGIPHATDEATVIGDLPSAQRNTCFLPVADLHACLNKEANFVCVFDKEPYRDPFSVLLLVQDASLWKEFKHLICMEGFLAQCSFGIC